MPQNCRNRLATVILILTFGLICQAAAQDSTVRVQAMRVEKGPHLDGLLSDQVWAQADAFTDFLMVEPTPGSEPSEKTELRLLYDEDNL